MPCTYCRKLVEASPVATWAAILLFARWSLLNCPNACIQKRKGKPGGAVPVLHHVAVELRRAVRQAGKVAHH